MVCEINGDGCPVCELRRALAFALEHGKTGAAFAIVELLLDAVEAVRECYDGGDADAAADAAATLAALWGELHDVAGLVVK